MLDRYIVRDDENNAFYLNLENLTEEEKTDIAGINPETGDSIKFTFAGSKYFGTLQADGRFGFFAIHNVEKIS